MVFTHKTVISKLFSFYLLFIIMYESKTYVFVTPSILQSEIIENGFKKTKNVEHNVAILFFLFTLLVFRIFGFLALMNRLTLQSDCFDVFL